MNCVLIFANPLAAFGNFSFNTPATSAPPPFGTPATSQATGFGAPHAFGQPSFGQTAGQ